MKSSKKENKNSITQAIIKNTKPIFCDFGKLIVLKRTLGKNPRWLPTYFLFVALWEKIFFSFFFNYPVDFLAIFAASTTDM